MQDVVTGVGDAGSHLDVRERGDLIFELVDGVVEAVDDIEELFGDLVEEHVEAHARTRLDASCGGAGAGQVARGAPRNGLADRDEPRDSSR